jgi:hypothetical protein
MRKILVAINGINQLAKLLTVGDRAATEVVAAGFLVGPGVADLRPTNWLAAQ